MQWSLCCNCAPVVTDLSWAATNDNHMISKSCLVTCTREAWWLSKWMAVRKQDTHIAVHCGDMCLQMSQETTVNPQDTISSDALQQYSHLKQPHPLKAKVKSDEGHCPWLFTARTSSSCESEAFEAMKCKHSFIELVIRQEQTRNNWENDEWAN